MNILALGAHPDDLELLCGGTLAKCALRGDKVTMCSLTNGNMGHPLYKPQDMARVRRAEMEASAALIGAQVVWLDVDDEMSEVTLQARLMITDLLRMTKPDVVITHYDRDYHVDHVNTSRLAFEAAPLACVHNIITQHPVLEKQVLIYYMDTLGAIDFAPTEYVDITGTMDTKKAMFSCHKSQDEWMKTATGFDMAEVMEAVARVRGYAAGCKYAEGFRRLEAWYRGTTTRVLP